MVISFSVKGKPNYQQYYRVWEYNRWCILYIAIPLSLSRKWHWSTWIGTETVKKVIVTNVLTPAFWDKLRKHVCKSTIDDGVGMTQRVTIMYLMGNLIIRYHLCRKAYKKCTFLEKLRRGSLWYDKIILKRFAANHCLKRKRGGV